MSDHLVPTPEENELNRFWNDLTQGKHDPHGYDLPEEDLQTLTTFQTRGMSIQPGPARERAWQEALTRIEVRHYQEEISMNTHAITPTESMGLSVNGRAASLPRRPTVPVPLVPAKSRIWPFVSIAAAAVLLVAAVSGYFLFGPGRTGDDPQPIIPAAVFQEATPSPSAASDETLLEVTLLEEVIPVSDKTGAGVAHFTIPVGYSATWTQDCCPGPAIEHVLQGSYTVSAPEETFQVIRKDGSIEDVPAGTEVTLGPGDSLLIDNAAVATATNSGAEPVELLSVLIVIDDPTFNGRRLPRWREYASDVNLNITDPPAPGLVRISRLTLDSDESWIPPQGALVFQVSLPFNDEGTPVTQTIFKSSEGVVQSVTGEEATVYVVTLEPAEPDDSTPTA